MERIYHCCMLDVTRLRVLVAVARHGSVTAAARAMNYAQPSVSHHLARLEAETGTRLTQRSGRGIRLTGAGRLLAERAEEVLGRLDAAESELAAYVGQQAERVSLAAFPVALATLVPAAAARLEAEHQGAGLALTEAEPDEAMRLLRSGRVDVALISQYIRQAENQQVLGEVPWPASTDDSQPALAPGDTSEGMWARLILDEAIQLVTRAPGAPVAPGSPGASPHGTGQAEGSLASYSHSRWIAGCEHCREHLLWQCAQAGFTPDIVITTDDHVASQALVAAGLGVTILPTLALRAARHPQVVAQPLPGTRHQVLAVTMGQPPSTSLAMALIELLASTARAAGA
jgi:DNA-binding transcriptional LysR family regulator